MAYHEDRVALARGLRGQLEVVLGLHRLAVLVDAQQREVEGEAGEVEVVRIAAEVRGMALGRDHEAHVLPFLVAVEVVQRAAVERDHVALHAGAALAVRFQLADGGLAGGGGLGVAHARLRSRGDGGGDVLPGHQHAGIGARALQLLLAGRGDEAVGDQVTLGRGEAGDAAARHMVVGEKQTVLGDEARRGAEAHRRLAHMLQPGGAERQAIALLDELQRRVVEGPHPFVRPRRAGKAEQAGQPEGGGERGAEEGGAGLAHGRSRSAAKLPSVRPGALPSPASGDE